MFYELKYLNVYMNVSDSLSNKHIIANIWGVVQVKERLKMVNYWRQVTDILHSQACQSLFLIYIITFLTLCFRTCGTPKLRTESDRSTNLISTPELKTNFSLLGPIFARQFLLKKFELSFLPIG